MLSSTCKNKFDLDSVGSHPIHGASMKTKYTDPVKEQVPVPYLSHLMFSLQKASAVKFIKISKQTECNRKEVLTLTH